MFDEWRPILSRQILNDTRFWDLRILTSRFFHSEITQGKKKFLKGSVLHWYAVTLHHEDEFYIDGFLLWYFDE